MSLLERLRLQYAMHLPQALQNTELLELNPQENIVVTPEVAQQFPHLNSQIMAFKRGESFLANPLCIGVVFSGGPAAGGHNVIAGIWDTLQSWHSESRLIGFIGGPSGIIDHRFRHLEATLIDQYRNQGGFDLLGSGRTKIETEEQFAKSLSTCEKHKLDGLVIIGGDDSNTNAALLAEYFLNKGMKKTAVVGVPKTIDGDLRNQWVELSFGFDSASKTYSEIIGNVLKDAASQNKYYFFVKVMGRTASHLVLECALQTNPQMAFIGEEVAADGLSLQQIVQQITDMIMKRAEMGKHHGVILIPEGIIEFIPEMKKLIAELNILFAKNGSFKMDGLSSESQQLVQALPKLFQQQLLLDRDPHGNVQVSKIETERLLIELVSAVLSSYSDFKGKFNPQPLFCGYEGRCCLPSNFDANYGYALGATATLLVKHQLTGYMATLRNLAQAKELWRPFAVPLKAMIELESRKGIRKPVIKKGLVDLNGPAFKIFSAHRAEWSTLDHFQVPGPIQFFGPSELTDTTPKSLSLFSCEASKVSV